jgi:uncharacterized membrane protein
MDLLTHLHPAVVHFPIALLLLGSIVALLHLLGRGGLHRWLDLRRTAWFLLGIGWLATIPAVLSGLLAQSSLPPDAPYRGVLNWHTATGLGLLVLYGLLIYRAWIFQGAKARKARAAAADKRRSQAAGQADRQAGSLEVVRSGGAQGEVADLLDNPAARVWLTIVLCAGIALIFATGWNGGALVYTWGVNVRG